MGTKKPNLYIIGAAKSGTTSLQRYLSKHREVFFCKPKEPRFFSSKFTHFPHHGLGDDIADHFTVQEMGKYIDLFKDVTSEKIIGEASVDYLYYYRAAEEIKKFSPDAKIIILLRNPVDRAFSAYVHLKSAGRESLSFEEGLKQEKNRMDDNFEFIWFYKDVGKYYQQVKTYLEVFGEENTFIILFDEMKKDIKNIMKKIMLFLNIKPDINLVEPIKYNLSGIPKNKTVDRIFKNRQLQNLVKEIFPSQMIRKMGYKILEKNLKKPILAEKARLELTDYFAKDIIKLQDLIGRDLSRWLDRSEP